MKYTPLWTLPWVLLSLTLPALAREIPLEIRKLSDQALEARVQEDLKLGNVALRGKVDDLFEWADRLEKKGDLPGAIEFWEKGLAVDSWRMEYQLKLAENYSLQGRWKEAGQKARAVANLSQSPYLVQMAKGLLNNLKISQREKPEPTLPLDRRFKIVLVPVGPVDGELLTRLGERLQARTGMVYEASDRPLDLPPVFKDRGEMWLDEALKDLEGSFSLKARLRKAFKTDPKTFEEKSERLLALLRAREASPEVMEKTKKILAAVQDWKQYEAGAILQSMRSNFTLESPLAGYLGVTAKDITHPDTNFVFGSSSQGFAVMSTYRFSGSAGEGPVDPWTFLLRCEKQGLSSSFFILNIDRCTSPDCPRAYPNDLDEHDRKGVELCRWCLERLAEVKSRKGTSGSD